MIFLGHFVTTKYISIFLVIVTDTETSIIDEKLRAFTVILNSPEYCIPKRKCFQKIRKSFNFLRKQSISTKPENFTDAVRRLETNYIFQKVYKNMFV